MAALPTQNLAAKAAAALAVMTAASTIPPPTLKEASPAFYRYVEAAKAAGCTREQIRNFLRAGVVLQPRQLEASAAARLCDLEDGPTELGYGGARGGGKSHWLLAQIGADDCQRYPGLKCLILRKVGKSLKEGIRDLLTRALRGVKYRYVEQKATIYFPNGSMIVLGHFQKESDIDTYLGLEYDIIGVEEATTLSPSKYDAIMTCCRTSKPGWRPRMYSTTNPGNIGHAWYKKRFIDPMRRGEVGDTLFVPATVDDNAFVNGGYKKQLEKLRGWQLQAWRFGDWDIAAGQFFTNFRPMVDGNPWHVLPSAGFDVQQCVEFWGGLDYGYQHYTTFYLFGKNSDGEVFCLAEHCERHWLPVRHVPAIKALLGRFNLSVSDLRSISAGKDIFATKNGLVVADEYEALGLPLVEAYDNRINGAGEILSRFGDAEAVEKDMAGEEVAKPIPPSLFILDRCARLIECLPALQRDPTCPERVLKVDADENGEGGDDPYDGFRYGVMADYKAPKDYAAVMPSQRVSSFSFQGSNFGRTH